LYNMSVAVVRVVEFGSNGAAVSGRFSPLTAPLPLRDLPLRAPLRSPLRSFDFLARSAPFSAQLTVRSNAVVGRR